MPDSLSDAFFSRSQTSLWKVHFLQNFSRPSLLMTLYVLVENPLHCDFVALRTVLMEMHTWNLVESTEHNHYEKYRSLKLASSIGSTSAASTPTAAGGNTMAASLGISANGATSGKESFYSKTSAGKPVIWSLIGPFSSGPTTYL